LERDTKRESEVQPKDGVDIYLRNATYFSAVSANRKRHLGASDTQRRRCAPYQYI